MGRSARYVNSNWVRRGGAVLTGPECQEGVDVIREGGRFES